MTSHDLLAGRRLEFGLMLRERGDRDGAASLFREALALAPAWAEAHFALAEALAEAGDRDGAVRHYGEALANDPGDRLGAILRLALLGAAPQPAGLPAAYVRTLFDQYAGRFDAALLERLAYSGPAQMRAAVAAHLGAGPYRVLDLGCGTGLTGEAFRDVAAWLEGVDLSPAMVAEAGRKRLYDRLWVADTAALPDGLAAPFDLVTAGDVVTYMGDLTALLAGVFGRLAGGGLFVLTAQAHDGPGFRLGGEQRFSHGRAYLDAAAAEAGFQVLAIDPAICRHEAGRPVDFHIAVLRREAAGAAVVPQPAEPLPLQRLH